jgi:hypothetical protein
MMKKTFALLALLILALAVGCSSGSDDAETSAAAGAEGEIASDESGSAEGGGDALPVASPEVPGVVPKVIQTASLRVSVAGGRYEEAVADARSLAARLGGFVVSSETVRRRSDRPLRGSLTLRIPSRRYAQAMEELGRLGRIESENEGSEDVSAEYVDLQSRARHLEAVERQLLELLERADTVAAALAVQGQLSQTQLELEQTRGRIRFLDDRTSYATISLELQERGETEATGSGWGIVEAWRDGAHAFVRVLAGAFVVLATLAPLLVLAALAFLGFRVVRRRRALPAGP